MITLIIASGGLSAAIVIAFAFATRLMFKSSDWPYRRLLLCAHSMAMLVMMAIAPLYIIAIANGGPYGDVYVPYLIVPGAHIYWIVAQVGEALFQSLLVACSPFLASVIAVITVPGLLGACLGGLQWYFIGSIVDFFERLRRSRQRGRDAQGDRH